MDHEDAALDRLLSIGRLSRGGAGGRQQKRPAVSDDGIADLVELPAPKARTDAGLRVALGKAMKTAGMKTVKGGA